MKKLPLSLLAGFILGLLDGLSAIPNPDAREMLPVIIVFATLKGIVTGLVIGLVASKIQGISKIVVVGLVVGTIFSVLAAIPSGSYLEIVIPGAIIGVLIGFITSKWGKTATV